jgi:nucleotide-binding universal stress UspA family protein
VGFDGSPEATAALDAAISLLGPRLGRLTVARVIPYDAPGGDEEAATARLKQLCTEPSRSTAGFEILRGQAVEALGRRGVEGGYQLLTIGTRGAGFSKAVLGSTASGLARSSKLPVLMVGGEATDAG